MVNFNSFDSFVREEAKRVGMRCKLDRDLVKRESTLLPRNLPSRLLSRISQASRIVSSSQLSSFSQLLVRIGIGASRIRQ